MGKLFCLNMFVFHSFQHGDQKDKDFAKFVVWNQLKGIAIANTLTFIVYFSRFKTYRNSYLLYGKNSFLTFQPTA